MTITQKLIEIQTRLHCPKGLAVKNYSGQKQYDYRNLAGIYERVKPLLSELRCALVVSCRPVVVGSGDGVTVEERDRNGAVVGYHSERGARVYQEATATLIDGEGDGATVSCTASVRENEWRKGMDASQISGSAESFASKYACEHLFALDSTDDADDIAAKEAARPGNAPAVAPKASIAPSVASAPKRRDVVSTKAKEAWVAFKGLPRVIEMSEGERTKTWQLLLDDTCHTMDAKAVDDAGWDRMLVRIANEKASEEREIASEGGAK